MKDWLKVEAVLFGSGKYLTEDEISALSGIPKKNLKHALSELKKHYSSIESSLDVFNEGNSWKLNVKEDFSSIVKNVISEAEMPKGIMETLALIAYKSPVLQSEIIDSRGTGAYEHIALLEEKDFITREKSGRSFKLKIAPKFFDYFEVEGDSKLRQMFKEVKKPETLGNLEVYTAKNEEEKEEEFKGKILERMQKIEETPVDNEEKKKFLNNFEDKFSKTKSEIDETDSEMNEFRKVIPPEKQEGTQEGASGEAADMLKKFGDALDTLEETEKEIKGDEKEEDAAEQEETEENETETSKDLKETESAEEEEPEEPAAKMPAKKEEKTEEKKESKKEEKKAVKAVKKEENTEKKENKEHSRHKEKETSKNSKLKKK